MGNENMDELIESLLLALDLKSVPRAIRIHTHVPDYYSPDYDKKTGKLKGKEIENKVTDLCPIYAGEQILRPESSGEHSHGAMILAKYFCPDAVDISRVRMLLLYHDMPEILAGDAPLFDIEARKAHEQMEVDAYQTLLNRLPQKIALELSIYWPEFQEAKTLDAKYARAIDRLEGLMTRVNNGDKLNETHGSVEQYWETWSKDLRGVPDLLEFGRHLFGYAEKRGFFN